MFALRTTMFVCALVAIFVAVNSDARVGGVNRGRDGLRSNSVDGISGWLCANMPAVASWLGITCNSNSGSTTSGPVSTDTPATTDWTVTPAMTDWTETQGTDGWTDTPTAGDTTPTAIPGTPTATPPSSPLERATWCRLRNGTTVALDYVFMNGPCFMCQCKLSRLIVCSQLQCLAAYCIDDTMPSRKNGQCCATCDYETNTNACSYEGLSYPHGTVIRNENNIKCWCQYGQIECRAGIPLPFEGIDVMGDGTLAYIIVIIIGAILFFGTLLCCGCTLFSYYYYKKNQAAFQQAYDYYCGTPGWQPMTEEEAEAGFYAEEKQAEIDQGQATSEQYLEEAYAEDSNHPNYMPPPYALYNAAQVSAEQHKQ